MTLNFLLHFIYIQLFPSFRHLNAIFSFPSPFLLFCQYYLCCLVYFSNDLNILLENVYLMTVISMWLQCKSLQSVIIQYNMQHMYGNVTVQKYQDQLLCIDQFCYVDQQHNSDIFVSLMLMQIVANCPRDRMPYYYSFPSGHKSFITTDN